MLMEVVIALFFAVYFTLVFLFLSSRSVNCSHCFRRYLFAFNVSTLLSTYDSNDFMTIPFYRYLLSYSSFTLFDD